MGTSRHNNFLHSIFENSMHSLNLANLYGEDLANLTAFLILVIELCNSFKPSLTTKFSI